MDQHPTTGDFEALLRQGSRPENASRRSRALRHLLAGCPSCQERIRAIQLQRDQEPSPGATRSVTDQSGGSKYDEVFRRAERDLELFLENGRPVEAPPGSLLAELFPLPSEGEPTFSDNRFSLPMLVKWLIARSYGERYENPEKMLEWAHMARLAAEACSPEVARSRERLADLRTQAWGQLGNAFRIYGRPGDAEVAFSSAAEQVARGTGDLILQARLLERVASFQIHKRNFSEAVKLLDDAAEIYEEVGELHQLGSTLVQKASAITYSGEANEGAQLLRRAIPLIDREEDPLLLLGAFQNLVCCSIFLGRPAQALALQTHARELRCGIRNRLLLLRCSWQEGALLRELGNLEAAREHLLLARRGFIARGLSYPAALISLDLAAVYSRMGRSQQVRLEAAGALPVFQSLGIKREALACQIMLQQTGSRP